MRRNLVIAFDQDRPIANLEETWVAEYNKEWNDNITYKDWTSWDVSAFVKPECGSHIFDIIKRPGFYRHLPVTEGAKDCIAYLQSLGFWDICFASASPREAFQDKYDWFGEHFPSVDQSDIIFVGNKKRVHADFLIDDRVDNLAVFEGIPILFDAPWNQEEKKYIRVYDHTDVRNLFDYIANFMSGESDTKMLRRALKVTHKYIEEDLKLTRRGAPYQCRY